LTANTLAHHFLKAFLADLVDRNDRKVNLSLKPRRRAVIGCLNPSRIAHMHLMLISLASVPPEGSDRSGLVVNY